MTISIIRETKIAEGAGAWPMFRDSKKRSLEQDLSVLTVQASTTPSGSLDDAARSAIAIFQRIIDSFTQEHPFDIALFAAHAAYQRNSPLVLRQGLWASLRIQYELPKFSRTYEHLADRSHDGHRKAGVAVLCRKELQAAATGLRKLRSAALLLADRGSEPNSFPVEHLYKSAFGVTEPASHVQWGRFVPDCLELGLLPVRVIGEFDDREVTIDIFAGRRLVDALAEATS